MNKTHNADALTLDTFHNDMSDASALLSYVLGRGDAGTLPRINRVANFNSFQVHARIWLAFAVKLAKRHGVKLPSMRRVTKEERTSYALALLDNVRDAVSSAEISAIDIVCERAPHASQVDAAAHYALTLAALMNVSSAKNFLSYSLNTRLTPSKRYGKVSFMNNSIFQRVAVIVSILALCLASVSCVASAVYQ